MSATPDTPELARMKQQLVAAEEQARRLSAELEKFSYSVSHDLRAPLRAINGFSQALLEDYGSTLPPDGQSLLARVRENATRMGGMIDDLLILCRLGRKQLDIVRKAARLAGVPYQTYLKQATMHRAIEDLRAAREAGIELD